MKKPNIFEYATSELSQDAFLKWLFDHLNLIDNADISRKITKKLIGLIIERYKLIYPEKPEVLYINDNFRAEIDKNSQSDNIDVFVTLYSEVDNVKFAILIEDKAWSNESREEQVETYIKKKVEHDSSLMIIPVYLKTGYMSLTTNNEFYMRKIVTINYQDIYILFSTEGDRITEDILLLSWWESFLMRFYHPIEGVLNLIDSFLKPEITIANMLSIIPNENYTKEILFDFITTYLFNDSPLFQLFNVSGKPGRTIYEYILYKREWRQKGRNYYLGFYFTYSDKGKPKFDMKTIPLKKRAEMDNVELSEYKAFRNEIRELLANNEDITKNYRIIKEKNESEDRKKHALQILVSHNVGHLPLFRLKEELNNRINTVYNIISSNITL